MDDVDLIELIDRWKVDHDEVFQVEAGGTLFVFRALTFEEFDNISVMVADKSSADLEDLVVETGVLWPQDLDIDTMSPGLITSLAEQIQSVSCLDGDVYRAIGLLDDWRVKVSGIRGEMKSFVLFAMPQYSSRDLDGMTFYRLAELVALSEKVIYLRQISEGVEVREPIRLQIYTAEEIDAINNERISDGGTATKGDPIAQKLAEAMR